MFVDALSRHPVSAVAPVQSDQVQRFRSDGELRKLQDHDPLLGPAIGVHLQKFPSPVPSAVANIVANTVMRHNVLCHETPMVPRQLFPKPSANYCCIIHMIWPVISAIRMSWTNSAAGIGHICQLKF